ncbi:MAG: hypothetical protein AB7E51_17565 [Pseudodesulfovibrio sp.]|uniref:hypothetical protein n=1 Tax=Pseudodesulfovibrio sp. TaxID=2035812 RepID=UPI003D12A72B
MANADLESFKKCWEGVPTASNSRIKLVRRLLTHLKSEIIDYYDSRIKIDDPFPPFWFGELQTNTFLTLALAKLPELSGNIMQEYPIHRVQGQTSSSGRVDYLCFLNGYYFAVETKQSFIRYCQQKRWTYLYKLKKLHQAAIKQLSALDGEAKSWLGWSVAISMAPVAMFGKSLGHCLEKSQFRQIECALADEFKPDNRRKELQFVSGFQLPEKLATQKIQCRTRLESYPAMFFIVTIRNGLDDSQ